MYKSFISTFTVAVFNSKVIPEDTGINLGNAFTHPSFLSSYLFAGLGDVLPWSPG